MQAIDVPPGFYIIRLQKRNEEIADKMITLYKWILDAGFLSGSTKSGIKHPVSETRLF
jgi:hypothetical protein